VEAEMMGRTRQKLECRAVLAVLTPRSSRGSGSVRASPDTTLPISAGLIGGL
jgi:hypothetical protein